jgi:type IV secretory pathway component VirB8
MANSKLTKQTKAKTASVGDIPTDSLVYRGALLRNRFLSILLASSVSLNILLVIAITFVAKISEPEVRYVEFSHSRDNFYRVYTEDEVRPESRTGMKLIRSAIREYVYNRHKKDHIADEVRGKQVIAMSTSSVINGYKDQYMRDINTFAGIEREIKVISDSILDKGIHQVEFETIDTKGTNKVVQSWNANIKYEFHDSIVNSEDELINPLNLYVSGYSISKRQNRKIKEDK